jgi:hypothetical protein
LPEPAVRGGCHKFGSSHAGTEIEFFRRLVLEQRDCKTPEMVIKEVAAHLLAYNLVRSVMAQSAR